MAVRKVPIAFLVSGGPVGIPDSEELTEKGQFYRFLRILIITVNTAFFRLYFLHLTGKIPTVNVKFPRLIPTFPHRNPVVFNLAVTVKSHFLASAVSQIFLSQ